ncbi:hypothetical protein BpHYR1_013084 [Brachionus plicatilis]|uniref:Uncharacterized protein n=1 Tax=Brachionus plicatilis TaxID=10195 RepID=A0A3M7PR36_BRAPC|nr:hypothetical protein BpHYR1_013084 [Brachionus plicatilis]
MEKPEKEAKSIHFFGIYGIGNFIFSLVLMTLIILDEKLLKSRQYMIQEFHFSILNYLSVDGIKITVNRHNISSNLKLINI